MDLLFKLLKLAGRLFKSEFTNYCHVVETFTRWNAHFAHQFNTTSPAMFKNMLLKNAPMGINFPIDSTKQLSQYLEMFCAISKIKRIKLKYIAKLVQKECQWNTEKKEECQKALEIIGELMSNNRLRK
jgi:hypothetical protein